MKHFINRNNFTLLFEQAIFSLFNFLVVINIYRDISTIQIASIGVDITALYGAVSICRNLISGAFIQNKFPVSEFRLEHLLKIISVRALLYTPLIILVIIVSCYLTSTDSQTTWHLIVISIEIIFVDNFRQIQILYRKVQFMSVNLILSILLSSLIFNLMSLRGNLALKFWFLTLSFYLIIFLAKYFKIFARFSDNELFDVKSISRKVIVIESLANHSIFYLYNFIFFHFNPLLSGEIRLITAWVVNAASSLYVTLNNYYTIRLVNSESNIQEQRSINLLAFLSLTISGLLFSVFQSIIPINNLKIDYWLIFGTCVSSISFFIHSRILVLYLHHVAFGKIISIRALTWTVNLGIQLIGTYFFEKTGFIISSFISFLFVLRLYENALIKSSMPRNVL